MSKIKKNSKPWNVEKKIFHISLFL